ncbi:uncharacterized protein LOC126812593 isoform X1 [Patella vulgata]|uniref:uncharacterized protein LOC126812593 isoform X1 n=3 Tax=Patella vulgata TaxID=6465 RepID=UPI0021805447|nr:uncharacterized protein LOC126812593 isoform X1 [Patella vulgata]
MTVLKVYLNWVNSILQEVGKKINGIPDIQEGKVLCELIHIVAPTCGIYDELEGAQNVDQHTYIQTVVNHMKKNGIKLTFDVQDIVDGDIKCILDCLWHIILNYNIHNIEQNIFRRSLGIGKQHLLEWCQKHLDTFFDGRISLTNNLCADNWFVKLLEKFVSVRKVENKTVYLNSLLSNIESKYGIIKDIINSTDIIDGTADEHALMIYVALLRRKIEDNKLADKNLQSYSEHKPEEYTSSISRDSPIQYTEIASNNMSHNQTTLRETINGNIVEYMNEDSDEPDIAPRTSNSSPYLREEQKAIVLKRPKDYYHQWENNIDRLSQGPISSPHVTETNSAPEDLVLNIDDFNDSFDKTRSQGEALYKPGFSDQNTKYLSDSQRSESRSPTRIVDRYQSDNKREYRHSPEPRQSPYSSTDSGSHSRSSVRYHTRRDDRSPSPEAYSHYDDLQQARRDVDKSMPKDILGNSPADYTRKTDPEHQRSRSDDREYRKSDDQISERTKALRKRASASLGRESRIRRVNAEMQAYNNGITQDMIRRNLGLTGSNTYLADPVNVVTPLRHIGSTERIYRDEDSTFIKQLDIQRNPPKPYGRGSGHIPRREAWERRSGSSDYVPYDSGYDTGHSEFIGSLSHEMDGISSSIESLDRSRRIPRFSSTGRINDKLWSQEFRDINSIRNPYRSDFNIHDDDMHLSFQTRSRSLSPNRTHLQSLERPKSSLGVCEPNYNSTFKYEDVGLERGKYPDAPLGRFDVRTDYYNPRFRSPEIEINGTEIVRRPRSISPSPQRISLGYSGPVRRVNEEIWGSDLTEIDGLDPHRQEKWKKLINLTEMSNEDVIELKQALASAIVENDILFAKITNAKKEFSDKLLKTNEVLDDCRKHLATAQAENQELRTFLNQEKRINAALEARIKELEEQLTASVSNYNLIEIELKKTVQSLETAKRHAAEMENCISENERLKTKMSTFERDNLALRQDLEKMQGTHQQSQSTIHELRKSLEDVRKERHDLYDELSQLRFKNQYGTGVQTPVKRYSDVDTTRSTTQSTSPSHVKTFKPVVQTSSTTFQTDSRPHSPLREHTSRLSSYTSSLPTRESTSVPIKHVSRLSPISTRDTTTRFTPSSYRRSTSPPRQSTSPIRSSAPPIRSSPSPIRSTTYPIRPRSESLGRHSRLSSAMDGSYNYKPTTTISRSYTPITRSTSPFRYSSTSTSVPSTHREIYPHRKYRYTPSEKTSTSDYNYRSTSAGGFTDYPDLQHFPTRLRYSDSHTDYNRPSTQYSAAYNDIKVPKVGDIDVDVPKDLDDDDEYEYEYFKKVTTITDHEKSSTEPKESTIYQSENPTYDRSSRRDTSYYRSPNRTIRSRSQSPYIPSRNVLDDDFNRNLDSVFDRHDTYRARSTSPARFPRRGILKNSSSEHNLDYRTRSPSPISRSYTGSSTYTTPSRYTPVSSTRKTVHITPTSISQPSSVGSTDLIRTTTYDANNGVVSQTLPANTKYKIEIDGDLSVTVNGNLNVVNRDNIRKSEPPPLTDEQRYYANQLIDKYTRPSCSLRTVNL